MISTFTAIYFSGKGHKPRLIPRVPLFPNKRDNSRDDSWLRSGSKWFPDLRTPMESPKRTNILKQNYPSVPYFKTATKYKNSSDSNFSLPNYRI